MYGAGGTTAESATDFAYDNAATTANLTKETKWDTPSAATTPTTQAPASTAADVTDYVWSQGNLTKVTDPVGDVTDLVYDELTDCVGYTNLYRTRIKIHSGQVGFEETTAFTYDCASGALKKSLKDASGTANPNAKAFRVEGGYDIFGRLTSITSSSGESGAATVHSSSTEYNDTARWVRTRSSFDLASDLKLSSVSLFDGLGRLEKQIGNDDAGGSVSASSTGGVVVERGMRYVSGTGRFELESSAYKPTPNPPVTQPTRAWTRRRFDTDGRLEAVHTFSGSTLPYPFNGATSDNTASVISSTSYSYSGGDAVTITDAASKMSTETRDALGRLTSVSVTGHDLLRLSSPFSPRLLPGSIALFSPFSILSKWSSPSRVRFAALGRALDRSGPLWSLL